MTSRWRMVLFAIQSIFKVPPLRILVTFHHGTLVVLTFHKDDSNSVGFFKGIGVCYCGICYKDGE